jgi:hypothetical protein
MRKAGGQWAVTELLRTKLAVSTFGEDEAGELYAADYDTGGIFRIEQAR